MSNADMGTNNVEKSRNDETLSLLFGQLRDSNAKIRREAAKRLAETADERAVETVD